MKQFFVKTYFLSYLLTYFDVRGVNKYFVDCSFAIRFLIFDVSIHKGSKGIPLSSYFVHKISNLTAELNCILN